MSFQGALGFGAWELEARPDVARLTRSSGTPVTAPSVSELSLNELGWQVPMDSLQYWVKGLPDPARVLESSLMMNELPGQFLQAGWQVSYQRWERSSGIELPVKLRVSRGQYTLKLSIAEWELGFIP